MALIWFLVLNNIKNEKITKRKKVQQFYFIFFFLFFIWISYSLLCWEEIIGLITFSSSAIIKLMTQIEKLSFVFYLDVYLYPYMNVCVYMCVSECVRVYVRMCHLILVFLWDFNKMWNGNIKSLLTSNDVIINFWK